jgi:dTMP kinase
LRNAKIKFKKTAEPTDLKFGEIARQILRGNSKVAPDALQFLFCADRSEHFAKKIAPNLREKKIVVCDRFAASTVAFGGLNSDLEKWEKVCEIFPAPDLTFFLKIKPAVAIERIAARGADLELFEKRETLRKVAKNYEKFFARNSQNVFEIDAENSIDEIATEVWKIFKKKK